MKMRSPVKRKFSETQFDNIITNQQVNKVLKHRWDQEAYQIQSVDYKGVSLEQAYQKPISVLTVSRAELVRKNETYENNSGLEKEKLMTDAMKRRFYPF